MLEDDLNSINLSDSKIDFEDFDEEKKNDDEELTIFRSRHIADY